MLLLNPLAALTEALRLLGEARQRGLRLRLLGGVAVLLRTPEGGVPDRLERFYGDLDFAGLSRDVPAIKRFFTEMGYQPHQRFNAVMGAERLLFAGAGPTAPGMEHIDVILDTFRMCHAWDLRPRLEVNAETLPLADLLLTKLQVVQLTEKDLKDTYLLLLHHDLGPDDNDHINSAYLESRLGDDWGLWRTIVGSLFQAKEHLPTYRFPGWEVVDARLDGLRQLADRAPKTFGWKARALIGERVKWYEIPGDALR
jgi:hypothetical protein